MKCVVSIQRFGIVVSIITNILKFEIKSSIESSMGSWYLYPVYNIFLMGTTVAPTLNRHSSSKLNVIKNQISQKNCDELEER